MSTGLVTCRGRCMPQAGHRILRRATDAVGQDETVAGALFDIAFCRHVSDRHRRGHSGQQPRRNQNRGPVLGHPTRVGYWHVDVRGVLRSAQTVRRKSANQTKNISTDIHCHWFRIDAFHSAALVRIA